MFPFSGVRTRTPTSLISQAYARASLSIRNRMASHRASPPQLQNTSQPVKSPNTTQVFQSWYEFRTSTQQWSKLEPTLPQGSPRTIQETTDMDSSFVLATWNIDAFAALPQPRMSGILSHLASLTPAPDVIFLQEVSRPALDSLLADARIREAWFSSEADLQSWRGLSFATMTLLSKARFAEGKARIGPVWRVKFESRFQRDALCCDIFVPSSNPAASTGEAAETRIRLINVHLDSLALVPSHRPNQLSIAASLLRSAERGLIAGDFNPVLPEDKTLVEDNGLVDAWEELQKGEGGFTWGVDGKAPYPPGRLDKVALLGLVAQNIQVMDPGAIVKPGGREGLRDGEDSSGHELKRENEELMPWSDHSGLKCTFAIPMQYHGRAAL